MSSILFLTNSEIARFFEITPKLAVLHDDCSINARTYDEVFKSLRRWSTDLFYMSQVDISAIGGMDDKSATMVMEIINTGTLTIYEKFKDKTPEGIIALLGMKGLGAKSLKKLWEGLDIEKAEDLLMACRRDELLKLKGFGAKSQETLKQRLMFFLSMRGYELFSTMEKKANLLLKMLNTDFPKNEIQLTGAIRRKEQILKKIEVIHDISDLQLDFTTIVGNKQFFKGTEVKFYETKTEQFGSKLLSTTGPSSFVSKIDISKKNYSNEKELFQELGLHFIPSELRHQQDIMERAIKSDFSEMINVEDIKGSLHMHTTDSDGLNSLDEMVAYADQVGYEYMLITDHSKSAGYANGLQIDRLLRQIDQIKVINNKYKINVYAGIESDILSDGSLDYPDDILAMLDIVVASVHSGLVMDIHKATKRVITAIENPFTRIMGHLTGRLLTKREAYPVDHHKILDACAANGVVMELNANPSRLDMDERYIAYAQDKGVLISINPDAHSTSQINMMQYGVNAARRGGLLTTNCLNAFDGKKFDEWVKGQ